MFRTSTTSDFDIFLGKPVKFGILEILDGRVRIFHLYAKVLLHKVIKKNGIILKEK